MRNGKVRSFPTVCRGRRHRRPACAQRNSSPQGQFTTPHETVIAKSRPLCYNRVRTRNPAGGSMEQIQPTGKKQLPAVWAHLFALFSVAVWGSCYVVTQNLLDAGFTAVQIAPIRMALAYVVLLCTEYPAHGYRILSAAYAAFRILFLLTFSTKNTEFIITYSPRGCARYNLKNPTDFSVKLYSRSASHYFRDNSHLFSRHSYMV